MTKLLKYVRWAACMPAGLAGGTIIALVAMGLVDLALDHYWLPGCIGCLLCGLLCPFAVYELGIRVAPDREELSRNLMLLANWLLLFLAGCDLTQIALCIPMDEPQALYAVSNWWFTLTTASGMFAGCMWIYKREDSETLAHQPKPVEFDWDHPSSAGSTNS